MYNKVILLGELINKPEVHYFSPNRAIARFTLKTTEREAKEGIAPALEMYHHIVAYTPLVENAVILLNTGDICLVEGKLMYRLEERRTIEKKIRAEIEIDRVSLIKPVSVSKNIPLAEDESQSSCDLFKQLQIELIENQEEEGRELPFF